MELTALLGVRPGVTAVIGGGGKTTLLRTLGEELSAAGHTVLLCTTTKIYPFPDIPNLENPGDQDLEKALEARRLVCAGTPVPGTGKLTAPSIPMSRLAELADFVLVEADGAAGRPFKAHAPHEPVIPPETNLVIYVVGASGFGKPVREAVHRPEYFWFLTALEAEDLVTPEAVAEAIQTEAPASGPPVKVFINQVEDEATMTAAVRLAELLPWPVVAGSLRKGEYVIC